MKKKALILGVGNMGLAISHAMNTLGFRLECVDISKQQLGKLRHIIPSTLEYDAFQSSPLTFEKDLTELLDNRPDVVISSLPYHQTGMVGHNCAEKGVRYCDLGGRVDVSEKINDAALSNKSLAATDLGLAPGWVNIISEFICDELDGHEIKDVTMMVGGLPEEPDPRNPFKYNVTWSVDGLINEYRDDCLILEDGEIKKVAGMEGLEAVDTQLGILEGFYTSGGASHSIKSMSGRGVTGCSYKTLRYKGHCDLVRFLIRDCFLPDSCLKQLFHVGCSGGGKDIVILKVVVESTKDGKQVITNREVVVNADDKFSAMQKATAFPISAVASLMAEGEFDHLDSFSYKDVPKEKFESCLNYLGIL
jgi:saccharopine dehydrogenase-like NADP-dependent oxidoreductase